MKYKFKKRWILNDVGIKDGEFWKFAWEDLGSGFGDDDRDVEDEFEGLYRSVLWNVEEKREEKVIVFCYFILYVVLKFVINIKLNIISSIWFFYLYF